MHAGSRIADFLSRLVVFALVLAGLAAVFVWYLPLIQRNQHLRRDIAMQEARIEELQRDITSMNRRLELSQGNSNSVERLVRENLGYARDGEYIIRFEDRQPAPDAAAGRPGAQR